MTGTTVSNYEILEQLGEGGMGVVYKALDQKLKRTVALKFLPPYSNLDTEARKRFTHEAQAASALDHPNIGTIHEINQADDGRLFIVMAYYDGETLKAKIARGALPIEDVLDIALQMADGLARAHEAGIVHRDIKPANVIVTNRGRVKIVDFGLAKMQDVQLTQTGTTMGTVAYMSPEQARGEPVDARTDVWSLGVVLYECLTGERPFKGAFEPAVIYSICNEEPEPLSACRPEMPEALSALVHRCLQKEPSARYQQIDEVQADLRLLQRELEHTSLKIEPAPMSSSFFRRAAPYSFAVLLLILLLLAGRLLFFDGGAPIRSIGVLPMVNLSGNLDQEHVADGMTSLLISNLSKLSGLERVISRTSMMQYKGSDKKLPEIGLELGVDALIEASVMSDQENIVVTVNLIETKTERARWGQTYERAFRDILELQQALALAIAAEIEVALTPQEETRLAKAREVDPRAMDRYLLGQNAWDKNELVQARDYFEEAIATDSSFAQPYAALPVTYLLLEGAAAKAKARRYAEKALELDPELSEAHVALGILQSYSWDWAGAEVSFTEAVRLNPSNSEAHREVGQLMSRTARFKEAVTALRRAVELTPLSQSARESLRAYGYFYARQYDQLIDDAQLDSAYYWLGLGYLHKGMLSQAQEAFTACCKDDTLSLAYFHAISGGQETALNLLRLIEGTVEEDIATGWRVRSQHGRWGLAFRVAVTYAALGEMDEAFRWLDRAREVIPWGLGMVLTNPDLDPLRTEPRFQALAREIGMDPWGHVQP